MQNVKWYSSSQVRPQNMCLTHTVRVYLSLCYSNKSRLLRNNPDRIISPAVNVFCAVNGKGYLVNVSQIMKQVSCQVFIVMDCECRAQIVQVLCIHTQCKVCLHSCHIFQILGLGASIRIWQKMAHFLESALSCWRSNVYGWRQ